MGGDEPDERSGSEMTLMEENEYLGSIINGLKMKLNAMAEENDDLHQEVEDCDAREAKLIAEVESLTETVRTLSKSKAEIGDLLLDVHNELQASEQEKKDLESKVATKTTSETIQDSAVIAAIRPEMRKRDKLLLQLETKNKEQHDVIALLTQSESTLKSQVAQLQRQVTGLTNSCKAEMARHRQSEKALGESLTFSKALEDRLALAEREAASLKKDLKQAQQAQEKALIKGRLHVVAEAMKDGVHLPARTVGSKATHQANTKAMDLLQFELERESALVADLTRKLQIAENREANLQTKLQESRTRCVQMNSYLDEQVQRVRVLEEMRLDDMKEIQRLDDEKQIALADVGRLQGQLIREKLGPVKDGHSKV